MSARQVTIQQRMHLDELRRLVLDELCRRYPDKWELVDSVSLSTGRRQRASKSKLGGDNTCRHP